MHQIVKNTLPLLLAGIGLAQAAEPALPAHQAEIDAIVREISPARIKAYDEKLVSFGTRHTMSDTTSDTRGIGAARRWVQSRFDAISRDCGGCLQVVTPSQVFTGRRIPQPIAYRISLLAPVSLLALGVWATDCPIRPASPSCGLTTRPSSDLRSSTSSPPASGWSRRPTPRPATPTRL